MASTGTGTVDFGLFDADNHYYEATDAFTRHLPAARSRSVVWAEIRGKQRLVVAGRVFRFIPNPTFDPVARPGALDDYFRGRVAGDDIRAAFGALEPISPAYRDPAARIEVMDAQGMDGCLMFPTLGVGVEEAVLHDPALAHDLFHAFNEWILDDWTFAHRDRIFAAPYVNLQDPERAVREAEWAIERGARIVVMRAGPVRGPGFSRSPGDPVYDPFWARLAEAGVTACYHSGDSGYHRLAEEWGAAAEMQAFQNDPFTAVTQGDRPIYDTIAALICHGVLTRHPTLRVATIEAGSGWVRNLRGSLKKVWGQVPGAFGGRDPVEQLRGQVWVSPYYEDDLPRLKEVMGADHILFGSDYPHAEGLADPRSFVDDLPGFTDDEVRLVMRENTRSLVRSA